MREIKFRAWSEYSNQMIDWAAMLKEPTTCSVLNSEDEKNTVMQYTGLKDKNGREIYEGDIAERNGIKYQITLEIGSFMLVKIDEEKTDMYEEFDDCWNDHVYPLSQLYWNNGDEDDFIHDLEVIGNIYENPELLGDTQ